MKIFNGSTSTTTAATNKKAGYSSIPDVNDEEQGLHHHDHVHDHVTSSPAAPTLTLAEKYPEANDQELAFLGALDSAIERCFMSKIVTAGAAIAATGVTHPNSAWAATTDSTSTQKKTKKSSKPAFRGWKEVTDATHNGTELNEKEAGVAGGLLDKMGINDIAPDKDARNKKSSPSR